MRFALALPAVLLTPSLLFAQSDRVRGCVEETPQGVVLRASGAGRQAFESQSSVDAGQRFLLVGDDDLLEEIVLRRGQEIQVTGRINPETSSPALVEPPIFRPPGGGTFPGAGRPPGPRGGNPFNPRVSVRQGDSRRAAAEDVIVVEDYRAVRPTCRDLERLTR